MDPLKVVFTVTYCPGHISREEIESVNYTYGDLGEMSSRYDPSGLKDGYKQNARRRRNLLYIKSCPGPLVLEGKVHYLRLMIRIVADDRIPFLKGALEAHAKVDYCRSKDITRGCEGCGRPYRPDTYPVRPGPSRGKQREVHCHGNHCFDHIDAEYCREAGIAWTSAPGCNSSSVEQYLVSTLLYLSVEKGLDLNGSVLGIVGVGNVGAKVARIADALGLKVLLNDPLPCPKGRSGRFCSA